MSNTTIKAIGFDYAGVIEDMPMPLFRDGASAALGVSVAAFKEAYFHHNHMINKGDVTEDVRRQMWTQVADELGKLANLEQLLTFIRERPKGKINQEMLALVDMLREKGYKVGLLSNNSTAAANEMRDHGIHKHFDAFIVSAEENVMKPEPAAFQLLAERLSASVTELVFIDDAEKSLSAASEIGFTPILFTDISSLRIKLKDLSII